MVRVSECDNWAAIYEGENMIEKENTFYDGCKRENAKNKK